MGDLDELEEANIAWGLNWLGKQKKDPKKYEFWIKLHKHMFSDVWTWAGAIRQHELENPDFLLPHEIWPGLYQLEQDLCGWIARRGQRMYFQLARRIGGRLFVRLQVTLFFPTSAFPPENSLGQPLHLRQRHRHPLSGLTIQSCVHCHTARQAPGSPVYSCGI